MKKIVALLALVLLTSACYVKADQKDIEQTYVQKLNGLKKDQIFKKVKLFFKQMQNGRYARINYETENQLVVKSIILKSGTFHYFEHDCRIDIKDEEMRVYFFRIRYFRDLSENSKYTQFAVAKHDLPRLRFKEYNFISRLAKFIKSPLSEY